MVETTKDSAGAPASFPSTMWSEVLALRDRPEQRRERMQRLIERYWKPVYWAFRAEGRLKDDEARDFTQEFFVRILEGSVVSTVDPDRGSFRHYLKAALKHFLLNEKRNASALKRGGGATHVSIDFAALGPEPAALDHDPDRALDQAWAMQILDEATADLAARLGNADDVEIFRRYELVPDDSRPSYTDLAAAFSRTPREIRTSLRRARRELRRVLLEKMTAYVSSEQDLTRELRELFES